jgi:uncharacterized CHY-type Zn-finger protein
MLVTCDRCHNPFDEDQHLPTILPDCAHTLCSDCVQEVVENEDEEQRCCNMCETPIHPSRVAEDFKINFKLLSLL